MLVHLIESNNELNDILRRRMIDFETDLTFIKEMINGPPESKLKQFQELNLQHRFCG